MANNEAKITLTADNKQALARIKEVASAIKAVNGQKITLDLNHASALDSLKNIADKIRRLPEIVLPPAKRMPEAPDGAATQWSKFGAAAAGAYSSVMTVAGAMREVLAPVRAYSAALEQNTAAFTHFLGSAELAKAYMGDLQKLAANTPFDLPGITGAGKKLLAFGFSAEQSLQMLQTISDAAAGTGQGTAGIDSIALALGQIKAKGKVTGDELRQLTEAGIPAFAILADQLGLSAQEIQNIGAAGLDADTAISALLTGMNDQFGSMAEKLSNTQQGMMTAIQGNLLVIGDFILSPLDSALTDSMAKVRDWSGGVADAIRSGDGKAAVSEMFSAIIPAELQPEIKEIIADFQELKSAFAGIWEGGGSLGAQVGSGILQGITDAVSDVMKVLQLVGEIGNTLMWIVNQLLPEGSMQFQSLREFIAFCSKTLLEFFMIKKITVLVEGLVGAVKLLGGGFKDVGASAKRLLEWFGQLGSTIARGFREGQSAGSIFKKALSQIWNQIKDLAKHPWKIALIFSASTSAAKETPQEAEPASWTVSKGMENGDDKPREAEQEPSSQTTPVDNTASYAGQTDALKAYEKMLNYQKESALLAIEQARNELEQKNKANPNGDQRAYYMESSQLDIDKIGIELATEEQLRAKIEATTFERGEDKQNELSEVDAKIKKLKIALKNAAENMEQLGKVSADSGEAIFAAAEKFLGTAYVMGGNGLNGTDCGKLTMDAYAEAGLTLARRTADAQLAQMEDAGGFHNDRSKLKKGDLVFYDTKYMPVSNDRAALNENNSAYKANHVGMYQGNGKILHAGSSAGVAENIDIDFAKIIGFGDYTAIGGTAQLQRRRSTQEKAAQYAEFIVQLLKEGDKVLQDAAETVGDISGQQIADINKQYNQTIEKFQNNHMPQPYIDAAVKVRDYKIGKLEYEQIAKDINTAYDDAARAQKQALQTAAGGSTDVLDAASKAAESYLAEIKDEQEKLKSMLETAKKNGWKDIANKIADTLDGISKDIEKFYKLSLDTLEENLKRRLALIESNPNLTKFQKEEQTDDARREYLQEKIANRMEKRDSLLNAGQNTTDVDFQIAELQNQLAGLVPTIDQVGQASKQAFEDGLFDFLSRGINECRSLGDAFRSMATSILEDVQKMYAKIITTDIMNALFPQKADPWQLSSGKRLDSNFGYDLNNPFSSLLGFADGGAVTEDQIQGPGTGVSDSILAWVDNAKKFIRVSDGEWIMKQKAVNYYGPNIMAAINRGMIPRQILDAHAKYANGGLIGDSMPTTGLAGAHGLTADFANNISPNFFTDVRIDGNNLVDGVRSIIKADVKNRVEHEMRDNLKRHSLLLKKVW